MKKILYMMICLPLLLLNSCDIHEWPETPQHVKCHLRLHYQTDMIEWEHAYDGDKVIEHGYGDTYDNQRDKGQIRYIIRTSPVSRKMRSASGHTQEFVFIKDIAMGYDHEVTLDLMPGDYNVMVWSDMVRTSGDDHWYDASDFSAITLQGDHRGNDDYRDSFRGSESISLVADIMHHDPDTLDITMQRPLAKFEFVTNDVVEFIRREAQRVASKADGADQETGDVPTKVINIDDYKVVVSYVGFMANAFSIYEDKPSDSITGVSFESSLTRLNDSEASIGHDYVFVNGKESAVTVRIGLYDKEGEQVSLTESIKVPLKRGHHTIISGMFLMEQASGGVTIDPSFDDDYNLIFP